MIAPPLESCPMDLQSATTALRNKVGTASDLGVALKLQSVF